MKQFKIVPLSASYASKIKERKSDDFGHAIVEQTAKGKGPCRVSLKPFKAGTDRQILISHSPFEIDNAFNQPGPVFIHVDDVEEYKDVHRFPPELKADKKSFPLSLIGYDKNQRMVLSKLVGDKDVDQLIVELFETRTDIEFLHARNAEACCYICKIERV